MAKKDAGKRSVLESVAKGWGSVKEGRLEFAYRVDQLFEVAGDRYHDFIQGPGLWKPVVGGVVGTTLGAGIVALADYLGLEPGALWYFGGAAGGAGVGVKKGQALRTRPDGDLEEKVEVDYYGTAVDVIGEYKKATPDSFSLMDLELFGSDYVDPEESEFSVEGDLQHLPAVISDRVAVFEHGLQRMHWNEGNIERVSRYRESRVASARRDPRKIATVGSRRMVKGGVPEHTTYIDPLDELVAKSDVGKVQEESAFPVLYDEAFAQVQEQFDSNVARVKRTLAERNAPEFDDKGRYNGTEHARQSNRAEDEGDVTTRRRRRDAFGDELTSYARDVAAEAKEEGVLKWLGHKVTRGYFRKEEHVEEEPSDVEVAMGEDLHERLMQAYQLADWAAGFYESRGRKFGKAFRKVSYESLGLVGGLGDHQRINPTRAISRYRDIVEKPALGILENPDYISNLREEFDNLEAIAQWVSELAREPLPWSVEDMKGRKKKRARKWIARVSEKVQNELEEMGFSLDPYDLPDVITKLRRDIEDRYWAVQREQESQPEERRIVPRGQHPVDHLIRRPSQEDLVRDIAA